MLFISDWGWEFFILKRQFLSGKEKAAANFLAMSSDWLKPLSLKRCLEIGIGTTKKFSRLRLAKRAYFIRKEERITDAFSILLNLRA
ncbi:MAG: hypothetical protein A2604_01780 [Candidatus Liptonbacteria bacterium RIFOXYD1_FULL_36_11]|uniref:Uncharacterized protein n=1 Tax=Candidatus Liptonbacteria bacterium RIFOXYD1_FULL_36_11 TaxID=1798656 RepID=A0A1G2CR29_9BACT|nr:MAG: hypothetical protein A2604_01780 [Candidatus Liptonbacteria bacterium RIFOXYD1_FULL_36_11]